MSSIRYVKGDATRPAGEGPKFIIHVCNDLGRWGRGFVVALSKRWAEPERAYRDFGKDDHGWPYGAMDPVKVEENLWVVNMIAQRGVGWSPDDVWPHKRVPPIRYKAVRSCLKDVEAMARDLDYRGPYKSVSIHCPKFGAGLAGGDWSVIEQIIQEELVDKGLDVTIYEFDG